MKNILEYLEQTAAKFGDRVAVADNMTCLLYTSNLTAFMLAKGQFFMILNEVLDDFLKTTSVYKDYDDFVQAMNKNVIAYLE